MQQRLKSIPIAAETHCTQEENSSTFKRQKEGPKARQIAKHHQQLKTTKYNGNQKAYQLQLKPAIPRDQNRETRKVNNITDLHRQSKQRLPKAYQLRLTFTAKHNIRNHRIQHKEQSKMTAQGTSTNPTNIMEQTPWPGNHEY